MKYDDLKLSREFIENELTRLEILINYFERSNLECINVNSELKSLHFKFLELKIIFKKILSCECVNILLKKGDKK